MSRRGDDVRTIKNDEYYLLVKWPGNESWEIYYGGSEKKTDKAREELEKELIAENDDESEIMELTGKQIKQMFKVVK